MIKKISSYIMVIISMFLVSNISVAGDIPESIMLGNQKSLFIGEINNKFDLLCTVWYIIYNNRIVYPYYIYSKHNKIT